MAKSTLAQTYAKRMVNRSTDNASLSRSTMASTFRKMQAERSASTVDKGMTATTAPVKTREQYIYGSADLSNLTYKTAAEYDNAIADLQSQADAARSKTLTVAHPAATLHNKGFRPRETEEYERLMSRIDALKAEKVLFDRATGIQTKYGALADNADYDANKGVQRHDEDPVYKAVNEDAYEKTYPNNHEGHYGWVDGGWVTAQNATALAEKYGWTLQEWNDRVAAGRQGLQEEQAFTGKVAKETRERELNWMTQAERDRYNYLYQTAGAGVAQEYLDDLKIILQRRNSAATEYDTKEKYNKAGKLGRVLMNAGTMLAKPIGTVGAIADTLDELERGEEYSPYGNGHTLQTYADTVRGETSQNIYKQVKGRTDSDTLAQISSVLYQGGMSAADAALGGLALGPGYLAVAGADAATHKAKELYESGAQDWQIFAGSVASGAIEALMEKVPLEELLKMSGGTRGVSAAIKNALRQSGIEGAEEALTEIANLAADSILQGGNSDLSRQIAVYEAQGYTPQQARQMAARDKATDVLWAAVGGMAGGIGSATAFSTVGLARDYQETSGLGRQFTEALGGVNIDTAIEIGLSNAKGTDARQMAEQIAQRVKNNQSVSAYQVGRMIQESQTAEARRGRSIEKAVLESAKQATVKPEVAETLSAAAVKLGQNVRFAPEEQFAEGQAGLYDPSTDTVLLNPKTDTTALLGQLLTHEMTHTAEGTRQLTALEKTVRRMMGETNWQAAQNETKTQYAERGIELTPEQVTRETVATWCAEHLFERGFAQMVVEGDASTGNAILQALDAVRRVVGIKNSPSAGDIASLERLYMQALENRGGAREGDAEYSVGMLSSGQRYINVDVDQTLFDGLSDAEKLKMAELVIKERFVNKVIGDKAHPAFVNGNTAGEYAHPAAHIDDPDVVDAKARVSTELDDLLKVAYGWHNEPDGKDGHYHPKAVGGFDHALVIFKVGKTFYEGTINVEINRKGRLLKDVTKIRKVAENNYSSREDASRSVFPDDFSDPKIAQNAPSVNTHSMQDGKNYSKGAYLPPERMTGDALIDPSEEQGNGETPSGVGDATSLGEGGYATPIDEAAVLETALRSQVQGRAESQAKDIDGIVRDVGDEEAFLRAYMATQIDRPVGTVEIGGREVQAEDYMAEVYRRLPSNVTELRAALGQIALQLKDVLVKGYIEEGKVTSKALPINLQLFAAQAKLEYVLDKGEEGTKTRRFWENRLKGQDANQAHQEELIAYMQGISETYNPISNKEELAQAKEQLQNADWTDQLKRKVLSYNKYRQLTAIEVVATQVLINNARNAGDLKTYTDLVQGLSRKGTELGRAVQAMSIQARLTPEGMLRAAQRTMRKQTDKVLFDGASEQLDLAAQEAMDALERLLEKGEVTPEQVLSVLKNLDRLEVPEQIAHAIKVAVESKQKRREDGRKTKKATDDVWTLADEIIEDAANDGLSDVRIRQYLTDLLDLPQLTEEETAKLIDAAARMTASTEGTPEYESAMKEAYTLLAKKIPNTKWEVFTEWRKFAMLSNPKTHLKNYLSNVFYTGVRKVDTMFASAVETALVKIGKLDPERRNACFGWSLTEQGRTLRKSASFEEAAARAVKRKQEQGAKYGPDQGSLQPYRQYFKPQWLENLRQGTYKWLEKGDTPTFRNAFKDALGQYMVAHKTSEITQEAEEYAYQKGLEAVFAVDNWISDLVSEAKRSKIGGAVNVVIPFHKTPANLATQAFYHSPIGLVKGAFDLFYATRGKNGKTAAEAINNLAKGITGTALWGIGLLLGSAGLFNTGFGKTEKERAADELAGRQENAFLLGDISISADWLQPTAAPLIMGASIAQRIREDGFSLSSVFGAVMDGTDSLFEMTMLQSLYDILGGYDAGASATAASVVENAVSQSIPTVFGQAARAIDPVQRKTTGDSDFETLVNQVMAKIPGLTYLLDPELDVWGEEVYRTGKPTAGNAALNILQQVALPANIKTGTGKGDRVSREILRLYGKKGESKAIPTAITRDEARDNGLDYVRVNKQLGATNRQAVEDFVNDKWPYQVQVTGPTGKKTNVTKFYSEMTDDERRRVLSRIYTQNKKEFTEPEEEDDYFNAIFGRLNNGNS